MNATEMEQMYKLGVQDAAAAIQAGSGVSLKDLVTTYQNLKRTNFYKHNPNGSEKAFDAYDMKSEISSVQAKLMTELLQ